MERDSLLAFHMIDILFISSPPVLFFCFFRIILSSRELFFSHVLNHHHSLRHHHPRRRLDLFSPVSMQHFLCCIILILSLTISLILVNVRFVHSFFTPDMMLLPFLPLFLNVSLPHQFKSCAKKVLYTSFHSFASAQNEERREVRRGKRILHPVFFP